MSGDGSPAAALDAARQLWLGGRPLEAGRALWALLPEARRARWAGDVLAWAYGRSGVSAPAVDAVIAAAHDPASDPAAAYRAVDAALRRAETSGRFDSLEEATLALARNAARLQPGAVPGPVEPGAGWWFVASLKCVGDELGPDFTADAWPILAQLD